MTNESRVLIIEDNDVLRVMLFTILRHQPLSVDTALTAGEAIEKTNSCDYALILLDADLPEGGAAEFINRFEAEHPAAPTFLVVVRGMESEPIVHARVGAVLNKPLEIDTLAELVRECAAAVPPPEEPQVQCPPAESEIRARLDRSGSFYSN
ncbi:MAG TPA: response regulator [Thermoanaerobaculia bacterium]|nr:response regulator [Thermoanaerobaculia bacterium]